MISTEKKKKIDERCKALEKEFERRYKKETEVWGKELIYDLKTAEITPEGIAYVCNNSLIEKAKEFLKDIKEITPFI